MVRAEKRLRKRRQAVGRSLGHLKTNHRMRCNFLTGPLVIPFSRSRPPVAHALVGVFWRWILSALLRPLNQGALDARLYIILSVA